MLLIGSDGLIKELFKAVCWCGQSYERDLKVRVAAANAVQMEKELRLECPELFTAGAQSGALEYDIRFLRVDVRTDELCGCIESCGDATYAVVAPGDDTLNIRTAVMVRTLYQRLHGSRDASFPIYSSASKTRSGAGWYQTLKASGRVTATA